MMQSQDFEPSRIVGLLTRDSSIWTCIRCLMERNVAVSRFPFGIIRRLQSMHMGYFILRITMAVLPLLAMG